MNIDSDPVDNLEPHKCEEWIWVSYDEVYEISQTNPERLFEPMINLLKGGKVDKKFWKEEVEEILQKETIT